MYLIYPYLNQWAFLEGFFGFVNAFANEFERFVEHLRFHCPVEKSVEKEQLLYLSNMIQFALFERSLEHRLRRRRIRRIDLPDVEVGNASYHWTEVYGERFVRLMKEHQTDWCRRFEEFDVPAHAVLGQHATLAARRAKRLAQIELDTLLAEIEDLLL